MPLPFRVTTSGSLPSSSTFCPPPILFHQHPLHNNSSITYVTSPISPTQILPCRGTLTSQHQPSRVARVAFVCIPALSGSTRLSPTMATTAMDYEANAGYDGMSSAQFPASHLSPPEQHGPDDLHQFAEEAPRYDIDRRSASPRREDHDDSRRRTASPGNDRFVTPSHLPARVSAR